MEGRRLMELSTTALISDANVLIDYFKAGRHSVLKLVSEHVCEIKVPLEIFKEVEQLTEELADELGLELYEESLEEIAEAARNKGRLSYQDRLCYDIAIKEEWSVWTSDRQLHRQCSTKGIPVFWGLQMLLILHERKLIKSSYAQTTAQKIFESNDFITQEVLDDFLTKLGQATGSNRRKGKT
jgi:rRNA-processing protein FCF1